MLITIVIAAYKVERYLRKCLESVLPCETEGLEVIIVVRDIGDLSVKIAEEYVLSDKEKIRIIFQDGIGLSNARNCGLREAQGDYIVFFDGDDYIDTEVFSNLLSQITGKKLKFDLLVSDFTVIGRNNDVAYVQDTMDQDAIITEYSYLRKFLRKRRNYWNVWQYIFNTNYLKVNDLFFLENVYSEDIEFTTRALLLANKICFSHSPYYHYRIGREGSLANEVTLKHIGDLMDILKKSLSRIDDSSEFLFGDEMKCSLAKQYLLSYVMIFDVPVAERRKARICFSECKPEFIRRISRMKILSGLFRVPFRIMAVLLFIMRGLRRRKLRIH